MKLVFQTFANRGELEGERIVSKVQADTYVGRFVAFRTGLAPDGRPTIEVLDVFGRKVYQAISKSPDVRALFLLRFGVEEIVYHGDDGIAFFHQRNVCRVR